MGRSRAGSTINPLGKIGIRTVELINQHRLKLINLPNDLLTLVLLGALRRWAPQSIDWTAMGDVVPVLDASEQHTEAKTARRH